LNIFEVVKTNPWFRYAGETREERNFVSFEDTPMNNDINRELTARSFHRFVFFSFSLIGLSLNIRKLRFLLSSTSPKPGMAHKQGVSFYCIYSFQIQTLFMQDELIFFLGPEF